MTFDKGVTENTTYYTYDLQISHKRYLDVLRNEFVNLYNNPHLYPKSPNDFDIIKSLGRGAFGIVYLVRDKTTFKYYAMKLSEKVEVVKKNNIKQLLQEKRILQSVNFPFLINLDFICKDNVYVYFILSFESGGELYSLMKKFEILSESLAQFYAAQIVLALEYLHYCSIIHRDVKPENILINESGYIKIGDFGFCKILKSRTWTLCGTPDYLAPEIILSKGYNFSVDWWAFGVLVYEMNAGYPPFYGSDPMKMYEKVLSGKFKTPEVMSSHCKSLVKHLLEVNPTKRLGCLKGGVFDIKSHPWFKEIDWYCILHRRLIPPYLPVCNNPGENFEDFDDFNLKKSPICLFETEFENF